MEPVNPTYGRRFWRAALDRALKTAAQGLIGFWAVGDGVLNVWEVDVKQAAGIALGGALLSLVFSVASGPVGPVDSPSTL